MKVGLGSFLDKPACSSPGQGRGFFSRQSIRGGPAWSSVFTRIRPVSISQGSHSVNERRDKNPGKYKPFRLRDLRATADCLMLADPVGLSCYGIDPITVSNPNIYIDHVVQLALKHRNAFHIIYYSWKYNWAPFLP